MICDLCSDLPLEPSRWDEMYPHHSSFAELEAAVHNGCEVCRLFKQAVEEYYAHGTYYGPDDLRNSTSIEEAIQYQRVLDAPRDIEPGEPSTADASLGTSGPGFFVTALTVDSVNNPTSQSPGLRGILYLRQDDDDRDPISEIYPFVEIYSLKNSLAVREWNFVGRAVSPTIDFSLAKSWIDDCATSHMKCQEDCLHVLPFRVLDLTLLGDDIDMRLLVNAQSHDRYAALSHCWGGSQPLQLLRGNYEQFKRRISYRALPKTFQDAVVATRSLGLRYLWIDSLCIIQNSDSDWEKQCTEMPKIYQGAFVTLAGPAASNCESGFLQRQSVSPGISLPLSQSHSSCQVFLSYNGIKELPWDYMPEPNSPLSKRAWVLQERLLSKRVLYFGTKTMYLECSTNVRFEDCYHPISWDYKYIDQIPKYSIQGLFTSKGQFEYWRELVETYSGLALTKPTDRFPALSAMASVLNSETNEQYIAGIWSQSLSQGLSWYIPQWMGDQVTAAFPPTTQFIAPSWSWASVASQVSFSFSEMTDTTSSLDLLTANITPKGVDPFGQITDGYLEVCGKIETGLVKRLPDEYVKDRRTFYVVSRCKDSSILAQFAPDNTGVFGNSDSEVILLLLAGGEHSHATALGIQQVNSLPGIYSRVGLAFSAATRASPLAFNAIFKDSAKVKIRII
ncbi:unnamed protein product [Clonostachys rosea]|uniref:Heterokaryon incompatibility domain-containing protein n=1 Tax=Bionectria ochroleuca TaxID=29856 RepID=A0ABY6U8B5_BIOOC|nr:unnamed protein product [Clonostachys rosea]